MSTEAAKSTGSDTASPVQRIAAFARSSTFETTRLTAEDLAAVKAVARPRSAIYVSAIPSRPLNEQVETSAALRRAGFEPVPHLAARNFASLSDLDEFLRRIVGEADVTSALAIAGDRAQPAGAIADSLTLIESGLMQRHGICDISIAGYAEGHPRIDEATLDRALAAKLAVAAREGLRVRIVTQFTMSVEPILQWIARLRERGIDTPVGVGLAGPASLTTLLRFARICGVKTSAQGLVRNAGLLKNLVGASTADPIVRALADAPNLGAVTPHFFSFGGLPATVRWAEAASSGRISLTKDGFEILK
jgi:methylenetetrahydrofolate reductase (NADPH)